MLFNDRVIFVGKDCFYLRIDDKIGIKVFYSFTDSAIRENKFVTSSFWLNNKMYGCGYCKKALEIEAVSLDTNKVKGEALGIIVEHVNVPMGAWVKRYLGYKYRFESYKHKENTIEGYERFVNSVLVSPESSRLAFANVGFDTIDKRWYVLDGNINE